MALRGLDQVPPAVQAWAKDFFPGGAAVQITQFPGGANNLVFGCEAPGRKAVVKVYPQAADPSSDRFRAESDFLAYAHSVAPGFAPELYEADAARRLLVMEYLDGTRFEPASAVTREDVARAAQFLTRLNSALKSARESIAAPAAEGFLTLTQHIENIDRRLADLSHNHLPAEFHAAAISLIDTARATWDRVKSALHARIVKGAVTDALPAGSQCISPSDFGFHNAMRCAGGSRFFDFEFAGWDDPAKAVSDFFLQPRIPVSPEFQALMESAVTGCLPASDLKARIAALRPVLHVKWITIVLAVLRPQRLEAMLRVTTDKAASALIQERLTRAHHYLSQGISHGLR